MEHCSNFGSSSHENPYLKKPSYVFKWRNWRCTVEERFVRSFMCPLEEIHLQWLRSVYQLTQATGSIHAVYLRGFLDLAFFDGILYDA